MMIFGRVRVDRTKNISMVKCRRVPDPAAGFWGMNAFGAYHFLYNFYNSVNRLCYKIIIVKIIMLRTLSVLIAPLHKSVKVLAQPYQL